MLIASFKACTWGQENHLSPPISLAPALRLLFHLAFNTRNIEIYVDRGTVMFKLYGAPFCYSFFLDKNTIRDFYRV